MLFPYGTANAYAEASYRLLDLASGRDVVVGLPSGASPTSAALGSGGLFVVETPPYSGLRGRLGFVPAASMRAALARAR